MPCIVSTRCKGIRIPVHVFLSNPESGKFLFWKLESSWPGGYVPLASRSPYPIRVHSVANYMIAFFPRNIQWKNYISNTKLEKGDHYYIQTRHKDLFSHYNLILRKLYDKMSRKALENTNEMCSLPLGILQYSLNRINSIWLPYR